MGFYKASFKGYYKGFGGFDVGRVPCMNPTILGVIGPGFLNQVPTLLGCWVSGFRSSGLLGGACFGAAGTILSIS